MHVCDTFTHGTKQARAAAANAYARSQDSSRLAQDSIPEAAKVSGNAKGVAKMPGSPIIPPRRFAASTQEQLYEASSPIRHESPTLSSPLAPAGSQPLSFDAKRSTLGAAFAYVEGGAQPLAHNFPRRQAGSVQHATPWR